MMFVRQCGIMKCCQFIHLEFSLNPPVLRSRRRVAEDGSQILTSVIFSHIS